jgi:hypothetical protein
LEALVKTLVLDEVMVSLLSEEVRWKAFESTNEALVVHGRSKEKGKKREKGRSKSHGRHKSPRKSKEKCWNYNKVGISEGTARKRRRRIRRKIMILMMSLKNILKRMVEMPLLQLWKPMQARVHG